MLKLTPVVFAVGNAYHIMALTAADTYFSVQVGRRIYHHATSGVVHSMSTVRCVKVPMEVLDAAGGYTVRLQPVAERKPYFTEPGQLQKYFFPFRPIPEENIRIYHIADAHNRIEQPLAAAKAFGPIDLLLLNGDLIDYCLNVVKFRNVYKLCTALTGGSIPVVFSRGNHDMRGPIAEKYTEYIPTQNGNTYYTFRLGRIWGVILDCGEDKPDSHEAYGGTIACHDFRLQQIDFLENVIKNAATEYEAPGITTKLVISHVPFTEKNVPPFDIEEKIYRKWCALLRKHIKPQLMICGHTHTAQVRLPGHERDTYGQPCPVVVASGFDDKQNWIGCGFVLKEGKAEITFTDSDGNIYESQTIAL